ncbi:serine/threonine protein kinase [Clostridium scatologenes]|uniref:Serine/threonine kinase related protein n=1 Tax=Clostridium scatologenes TaxID=1548 RepID=A0A0E3GQV2_CLOSL|nr:serine/threonine protein kinase [Clostridium scatologenes]AKA69216.1 serine/threonine kinase related protein [Clostridium scatologenes]
MNKLHQNYYSGIDVSKLKFIGKGSQGKVYFLPPDKVIKVFFNDYSFKDQIHILKCAQKSRFFTKIYNYDDNSIIMDYVPGPNLKKYLKSNSLDEKLAFELVELIYNFELLGFTRLNIRAHHIFVQSDKSIKVIDPRKNFEIVEKYPVSILRTLKKYEYLNKFFKLIENKYPNKYSKWKKLH